MGLSDAPYDGRRYDRATLGEPTAPQRQEAEPVECYACGGTGLRARRPGEGQTDRRCRVCDGYGVLPKPDVAGSPN
jgi:DnaJ-class molecular chaperone